MINFSLKCFYSLRKHFTQLDLVFTILLLFVLTYLRGGFISYPIKEVYVSIDQIFCINIKRLRFNSTNLAK